MKPRATHLMMGLAAAVALTAAHRGARADAVDRIGRRLIELQGEAQGLSQGIRRPEQQAPADADARRLIDAQVAFGIGNFDDAALMLYDFVESNPRHRAIDEALYYLAESLFQKGDNVAARSFFLRLVNDHPQSKFYQQGLERLVELSLKLRDATGVDAWLTALANLPAGARRPSVPYVRGKYAFFSENYAEALQHFREVESGSQYWFQAKYFTGASHIALGNLTEAVQAYSELVKARPQRPEDKRVLELAHMALGRLYYERDQPSKAIDEYLMISRRSDLFDEALYEVAWVYVKSKQFEKALRALELLALTDPTSSKMPEVRILEGNLRIRKAQNLAALSTGNDVEEYVKAIRTFEKTREAFDEPYQELVKAIEAQQDPSVYLAQITGRTSEAFDVQSTLPETAAAWIREQPEVQRVVGIETDLAQISDEIGEAERTIGRLEHAISSPSRVHIFPTLADKRTRSTEILEELFRLRQEIAQHERGLVGKYATPTEKAELQRLQSRRAEVAAQLAELPNAGSPYGQRVELAKEQFDQLDQRAAEIRTVIDTTMATIIALEKYMNDEDEEGLSKSEASAYRDNITELQAELLQLQRELEDVRREMVLARDLAGTGDEVADRAVGLRAALRQALDDEHRYMTQIFARAGGRDRTKADQITSLTRTANAITVTLDQSNEKIDKIVDLALADVRGDLEEEKAKLAAYKREFITYEGESRELGGAILASSFGEVKDKFYDIIVRSDIGIIDVTWSQKESVDEATQRLGLDKQREIRTLREDFRELLEGELGEE